MKLTMYQMDAVRVAQRALREEADAWDIHPFLERDERVTYRSKRKALRSLAKSLPALARIALIPLKGRK